MSGSFSRDSLMVSYSARAHNTTTPPGSDGMMRADLSGGSMGVPLVRPVDRALLRPYRRGLAALVAAAALVVAGAASLAGVRPPAPVPADAAAADFSADRAFAHVSRFGTGPHVAGSAANDRVRDDLMGTLSGLGLRVEVQDTVAVEGGTLSASAGGVGMARVRNVVAVLPGAPSPGWPAARAGRPGRGWSARPGWR
jgi:hypothetical protein